MPELPEVETIARRLREVLVSATIKDFQALQPRSFGEDARFVGLTITDVSRRAKLLQLHLNDGTFLVFHFKMTGQLIYVSKEHRLGGGHPTADWVQRLPSAHTRLIISLLPDAQLYFNDQRLFGWLKHVTPVQLQAMHQHLGPDVTDPAFSFSYFVQTLSARRVPIKVAIMDNAVVAGIGNIYACEALNAAGIQPWRKADSLTEDELQKLWTASRSIINQAIELGGTTSDGKYVHIDGFAGRYQRQARVYGRQGLPCPVCAHSIEKKRLAGRGTYYCPQCQT